MNAFLRRVMARRDAEHEERIVTLRAIELPKEAPNFAACNAANEPRWAEQRRQIIELAKANPTMSATKIGERVEASHTTVLSVLRKAGLRSKASANQWTLHEDELKARQEKCRELRAEGLELAAIAERLGITERQVRYALKAAP